MMVMNFKFRIPNVLKSVRLMLAIVNSVFLVTGLILLFVSIAVLVRYTEYDAVIRSKFFYLPWFGISTGIVILLGSVLGLHAVFSGCFFIVAAYEILLLVVLSMEITIIIIAFSLHKDAVSSVELSLVQSLQEYGTNVDATVTWDQMQKQFECCGVSSFYDYETIDGWIADQLPVSCCLRPIGIIMEYECNTELAYHSGCGSVLGEYLAHQAYVIAISASIVTSIQVILATLTATLIGRAERDGAAPHIFVVPEILTRQPSNLSPAAGNLNRPSGIKLQREPEMKKTPP